MSGSRSPKAPASRAGNRPRSLSPSVPCPAAVATTNLNLTHKPPESQSAGEGDAQEFILRFFSLTPLCSAPSADETAAGTCVLGIRLPSLASPRQGEGGGRAETKVGLPRADKKPQEPVGAQATLASQTLRLSGFGSSPPPPPLNLSCCAPSWQNS